MKCPNCQNILEAKNYLGIPMDVCPKCGGMWLDQNELDQLEDQAYDEDDSKGSLDFDVTESKRVCPKCQAKLKEFNYRLDDVKLEFCPNGDGYFLDKGEEERVLSEMQERKGNIERTNEVEEEWAGKLQKMQSPGFFQKIKNKFN